MNIVFFGTSLFGIPALERLTQSGHRLQAVVTQPDRPRGRGQEIQPTPIKEAAVAKGIYLYQPEDCNEYSFIRELRALSPDVIVVVAYGQKLGDDILTLPRFYTVNIHPSLLPKYRGPAPVARALLNGDAQTGVSIIKVVQKMDAGPILGVRPVPVPPEATTPEMEDQLSKVGADLLIEVIDRIQKREVVEKPQIEREATYARKFEKKDGRIDWRKPALKIANFVRALQPFPGAFTFFNRTRVSLFKVKPERAPQRPNERPGLVTNLTADSFSVTCTDGVVKVLELQPESKRRMTAAEFLNGFPLKPGDRVG